MLHIALTCHIARAFSHFQSACGMFEVDYYYALVPFAIVRAHCCVAACHVLAASAVERRKNHIFSRENSTRWFFTLLFLLYLFYFQLCCKTKKSSFHLLCCSPHTCLTFMLQLAKQLLP